ncbi:sulfur carrier protein ThiS [Verrucomicrobiota bacterium]
MNISVNGENVEMPEKTNVSSLLTIRDAKMPDMVSVKLNDDILDRNVFETTLLKENDNVEFLYFMGGGERK